MTDFTQLQKLTDSETKEAELSLLWNFLVFCREEELTCFLAYGTLIGAIRHKGFIPWDDDIDLMMPRPDYQRLALLGDKLKKRFPDLSIVLPGSKRARHTFIKVINEATVKIEKNISIPTPPLGIDIDIFPLDAAPASTDGACRKVKRKLDLLYNAYTVRCLIHLHGSFLRRLISPFRFLLPSRKRLMRWANRKLIGKTGYESAEHVVSYGSLYNSPKNIYDRAWFDGVTELSFEGHSVPAPIGYDCVLRAVFGDYMQLPPKEQRITHHTNQCYRRVSADIETERNTICKD